MERFTTARRLALAAGLLGASLLVWAAGRPREAAPHGAPARADDARVAAARGGGAPRAAGLGVPGVLDSAGEAPRASGPSAIPDVPLVDANGKRVRFYSDLVAGKTVAIQFVYTRCKKICLPQGQRFAALRRRLHAKLGDRVNLISITLDPGRDTPEDMAAWGRAHGAGPGWHLLTGARADVDRLLVALRGSPSDPTYHGPAILIGNEPRQLWQRTYGLAGEAELTSLVEEAAAGRPPRRISTSAEELSKQR